MFLDSFKNTSHKELEEKCEQLSNMFDKKQAELGRKEIQIQNLSKNLRQWTRKYHELELSISETLIESNSETDYSEHDEETKHLQTMLLRLNRKNVALEKRLQKMYALITEMEADEKVLNPDKQQEEETTTSSPERKFGDAACAEPEFSPQFQMVLEKHANACKASSEQKN